MVCVLKNGDSCRHRPFRPIPAHNTSPILPTDDGTHPGSHGICLPASQHIPDPLHSKERKLQPSHIQTSVPLEVRWSRQSLMKERQLPQILFRENPSPGGISYNPADNGSSPKDWGRLRKKKQTAPPCGRGLSILTCYFNEGRGERRVISTKQATRWKANHNFLPPFSPQISWNDQK